MIQTQKNFNLKSYNTFGFDVSCKGFISCNTIDQLQGALSYIKQYPQPYLILGGGSNILFSNNFNGIVIHPAMKEICSVKENDEHIWLDVQAGVVWDELVEHCVNNNWFGLENLSYIPGNVGASPVQNIGAYGAEVKDCIEQVNGIFIENNQAFSLSAEACQFAYRQSIFKGELKNKTVITSVVFKLNKTESYNLSYGPIKEQVEKMGKITLPNVRTAIIDIRKSKLPEPEELGNAGSFFKNPVISKEQFATLHEQHSSVPSYPVTHDLIKIPAGWLIEQAGWKGKALGKAAVHNKQALVLVNKGGASGKDMLELAHTIMQDVNNKFGISIEPEVNII
ncbi:UDP-N-acetylmuramate dehydrogenase [Carboxylicivirga sediminis]|uniref:UDP-N-acetylmuramate dehydrogenase n=1 Tax=Carboxylicivirga sediminis TaxID=2006564 RepID=UPI001FD4F4A7|nr:UDP-N-acetylmuramate dehydrogenase [Carboxylicivirga sediminis]